MSQTSEIPSNVHYTNGNEFSSPQAENSVKPQAFPPSRGKCPKDKEGIRQDRSEIPAVSVRNASKSFPNPDLPPVEAIADVSLDVHLGEFVVIVGPSGCGKSTLLNIIAGLVDPDIGSVYLQGDSNAERIGRVAYMHQIDLLLPWRNVLSNATLGLEIAGIPRTDADAKATELARRFGIADFLNAYPATLSGGMRQRVALLRAVLPDRDVLLLDEPFKALDAITRAELQRWLSDVLDRTNRATVMVTHDVEEALMLGDRVLVMSPRPGRILLELDVDLPRPRPRDVVREPNFVELKWQLLSALDDEATR